MSSTLPPSAIAEGKAEIAKLKTEISKIDVEIEAKQSKIAPKVEEPKLSKWERTKNFWNLKRRFTPMALDYKRVATDLRKDFPKMKIYYSSRFLLTGAFIYGVMSVPTKEDHGKKMQTLKHKMMAYGTNRNPTVNEYIQKMVTAETRGLLSHTDCWAFSVVHKNIYPVECGCSEAVYSRLKHRWYNPISYYYSIPAYVNAIVDVGVFNRFLAMEWKTGEHTLPDIDLVNQMNRIHRRPDLVEYYPNHILESDDLQTKTIKTGKQVLEAAKFYVNPDKFEQVPVKEQRPLAIDAEDW